MFGCLGETSSNQCFDGEAAVVLMSKSNRLVDKSACGCFGIFTKVFS